MNVITESGPTPDWPLFPTFAFLILGLSLYTFQSGVSVGGDTEAYVFWADRLTESGFDFPAVLRTYGEPLAATYAFFVGLVALIRLAAGEYWAVVLIALNVFAVATVGAVLTRLVVRISGERAAGWASLALFVLCHDIWLWTSYVLSDSIFLLLAFAVFLMEISRILSRARRWTPVFAASAAASLFRPTGIVLFPVTAWVFLLTKLPSTLRARRVALLALFLAGSSVAAGFGWIVEAPARWPLHFGYRVVQIIAAPFREGLVVWQRPESYLAPPETLTDYWAIMAARFVWFFSPGASGYSLLHWVGQIAFYLPTYTFAGWFVISLITRDIKLTPGARDVGFAAIGGILLYAFFHAMMHVDYDWRYRLPIMPHLILLAALGFADVWRCGKTILRASAQH